MRQTLFHIPPEVLGLPVFGVGWLLIVWLVLGVGGMAWLVRRQGWNADTRSYLPVLLLIGAAIAWGLPLLEESRRDGTPLGLPVRGYGVMLLLGVLLGVGWAAGRARRMGIDSERIFSLAFWMFLAGIVGARAFFVIQYWPQFQRETLLATIAEMLKFTEGGLVVYGSVMGALGAGLVVCLRHRLPPLAMGDLIAPCMLLGLALGRIGCLLNGCCFGGLHDHPQLAVTFPESSPPYHYQYAVGHFHGLHLAEEGRGQALVVKRVDADSPADAAGLAAGDRLSHINGRPAESLRTLRAQYPDTQTPPPPWRIETVDGRQFEVNLAGWPARSRPVYPTQVYSSINAAILALLLAAYYPFRRRNGEVVALMLTLYPLTRFLLEVLRTDEPGVWGTPLSISQVVSLSVLVGAALLWGYLWRQPRGRLWPPQQGPADASRASATV